MHNFIRIIGTVILGVILCSCSTDAQKYKRENVVYETDSYIVNSEKLVFNLGEECILNLDIEEDRKLWLLDFEQRVLDNKIEGTELPNMQIQHKVYDNNKKIISMVTQKYIYITGAHGNTWWKPRNYDVLNNTYLALDDLFYDDEYIKILNNNMQEMAESDVENYHDLWEKPEIKNGTDDNFYIDGENLVIFFQPYELSFYAKGVVEFPIKIEELRGYIKEEYLKN